MYFGHKHVETGPNYSHELSTFLKYHMPVSLEFRSSLCSIPGFTLYAESNAKCQHGTAT